MSDYGKQCRHFLLELEFWKWLILEVDVITEKNASCLSSGNTMGVRLDVLGHEEPDQSADLMLRCSENRSMNFWETKEPLE